jgi:hypothetical protein
MNPRTLLALFCVCLAGACSTASPERVADAATTPLKDLNVVKAEIPPALQAARRAPYALPADASCTGLRADIKLLDELLGPDLDAPPSDKRDSLLDRGQDAAGNAAVGAVQRTAEDVVPFRGWVRKLTGAERHSREVAAAISAGAIRRGFLKGLARAGQCA